MKRLVTILIAILSISQLYSQNRIGPYRSIPLKSIGNIIVTTYKYPKIDNFLGTVPVLTWVKDSNNIRHEKFISLSTYYYLPPDSLGVLDLLDTLSFDVNTLIDTTDHFLRMPYQDAGDTTADAIGLGIFPYIDEAMSFNAYMDPFYKIYSPTPNISTNNPEWYYKTVYHRNNSHRKNILLHPRVFDVLQGHTPLVFQSLYLKPTLKYDSNKGMFVIDPTDKTGAIFGWRKRSFYGFRKDTVFGGDDNKWLKLRVVSSYSGNTPYLVLWNSNEGSFFYKECFKYMDTLRFSTEADSLYLSVNLRMTNPSDTSKPDTTKVLGFRIKIKRAYFKDHWDYRNWKYDSTTTYFTKIPRTDTLESIYSTIDNAFLGYTRTEIPLDNDNFTDTFIITKNMLLPPRDNTDSCSITLSALAHFFVPVDTSKDLFLLLGKSFAFPPLNSDFYLSKEDSANGGHLDSNLLVFIYDFDIEVYYYNNIDVAINWVRLESQKARDVYRGKYDGWLAKAIKIYMEGFRKVPPNLPEDAGPKITPDSIENWTYWQNYYHGYLYDSIGAKVHRFFLTEEKLPSFWGCYRYLNLLLDTLATTELNDVQMYLRGQASIKVNMDHFLHSTGFKGFHNGRSLGFNNLQAAPYIRYAYTITNPWGQDDSLRQQSILNQFLHFTGGYAGGKLIDSWTLGITKPDSFIANYRRLPPSDTTYYCLFDTLNSAYEYWGGCYQGYGEYSDSTFKIDPNTPNRANIDAIIEKSGRIGDFIKGPLVSYEMQLWDKYLRNTNMLFGDKPWWNYAWISSFRYGFFPYRKWKSFETGNKNDIVKAWNRPPKYGYYVRPVTGEETRLMLNTPIILGCKGLSYWYTFVQYGDANNENGIGTFYYGAMNDIDFIKQKFSRDSLRKQDSLIYAYEFLGDYLRRTSQNLLPGGHRYADTMFRFTPNLDSAYRLDIMGIDSLHIYTGSMSNRAEMGKIFRWVEAVEDTLLHLKPIAFLYKGINKFYVQDTAVKSKIKLTRWEDATFIDTLLKRFVNIDSIKTRKLTTNEYDPDTLTYYLISLYRWDTDTSVFDAPYPSEPKKTVYYIGILNPRTDPLVRSMDTIIVHADTIIDSTLKFYSTAEFDQNVQKGGYKKVWNPDSNKYCWADPSYWRKLWWKRQGAREITLPLILEGNYYVPYMPALYSERETIVEELGAYNEKLDSNFYRDSMYYHKVVARFTYDDYWRYEHPLKIKLLPGEAKILKITTYSYPQDQVCHRSDLPYLYQNKLITHTINFLRRQQRDSIYHHIVYHRFDSTTGRSKVFYRRSLPITYDTLNPAKENFGPEICLSDSIRCWREPERIITNCDCAYPSLVVRYDSITEKTKVYVTFVCKDADSLSNFNDCLYSNEPRFNCPNGNYTVVAENVFDADDTIQQIGPAQAIRWACGDDYNNWGVPVVNASYRGNYYAWADSVKGIVTGFKRPWEWEFPIGFNFDVSSFRFSNQGQALSPSLPAYSRIHYYEDGTPIVWLEKGINGTNNLYYSLLRFDSLGFVRHYLPLGIGLNNPNFEFNADSSIVRLSYNNETAVSAVIYRGVEDSLLPPGIDQCLDIVAWETQRLDTVPLCSFVRTITVQHFLNANKEIQTTSIKPPVAIQSEFENYQIAKPVVSQGSSGTFQQNQGPVVLEMILNDTCPSGNNFEKKAIHMPYDFFISETPPFEIIYSNVKLIQLTRRPFISPTNDWWQNIRAMQVDTSIDLFCTSTRKFYKRGLYELRPYLLNGFCGTNNSIEFLLPRIDGVQIKWQANSFFPEIDNYRRYKFVPFFLRDTLTTNWFKVKELSNLNVYWHGVNNNQANFYIQRQSDKRLIRLNLYDNPATKIKRNKFVLANPNPDEKYRFVLAKTSSDFNFCQKILFMPSFFEDEDFYRQAGEPQIIDLGETDLLTQGLQVSVFPNPSNHLIYLKATLNTSLAGLTNQQIFITFYNSIGEKVYSLACLPGVTVQLSTEDWSSGIYFIVARCCTENQPNVTFTTFFILTKM